MALPPTADAVLNVARSQIGYHEGRDPSGNWNNDTKFGLWYGLNYQPWCAMFISWCAFQTGATGIIPRFAYCPSGAAWFKNQNKWGTVPRKGAIVFFDFGHGIAHVGIVEAVNSDGSITTIEGNTNTSGSAQGDGVYRMRRKANIAGYGYPSYTILAPSAVKKAAPPRVSLAQLQYCARHANDARRYPGPVSTVQAALRPEGLLGLFYVRGTWGQSTRQAYARWQVRLGYRGADADGIPGLKSLTALAKRHGFIVTP